MLEIFIFALFVVFVVGFIQIVRASLRRRRVYKSLARVASDPQVVALERGLKSERGQKLISNAVVSGPRTRTQRLRFY